MSYIVRTQFDGYSRDGHRSYNKGGGGGGGSTYYANQDKLLGVQADIAQNMYNTYANYAPSRLDAMDKMVNEAMDGTLADRARNQAAADAGASLGNSLQGAQRSLERYGTTLNPNALNANLTNTALSEAAVRSGAMNRAQQWAEGQRWARNQDMYSTLQGMPGNATQALGSAASGYGQMAGQQNQVNMANAMGYGQMGGMIGYGLLARDGGYIHEGEVVRRDDEPGYAMGGRVAGMRDNFRGMVNNAADMVGPGAEPVRGMANSGIGQVYGSGLSFARGGYVEPGYAMGGPAYSMPKLNDWRSYGTTQQNDTGTPSPVMQVATGMAPALGMMAMKKYVNPYIKDAVSGAWDKGVAAYNHAQGVAGLQDEAGKELAEIQAKRAALEKTGETTAEGATTTPLAEQPAIVGQDATLETGGKMAADSIAADTAATTGAEVTAEAGTEAAATAAAEEAATAAAAETAAAGTAEAAGAAAALGPIGWAAGAGLGIYALGNAMDWWADGGPVPHRGLRKNMIPGGHVKGAGTETSDSIPAWLSDGEYVINADAVKEVGKKKLEKINEKGLKKRKAKAKAAAPKAAGLKKKPVKK